MDFLKIITFIGFIVFVAIYSYMKTRKTDKSSKSGYFLGGRSFTAPVIASTLMLTNLSTEQLVGQSGQAYGSGLVVIAWESVSAVSLVLMAMFFLPKYLQRSITTISEFVEERYDLATRTIIDFCFLIATGICFLPVVLYSGALGINGLFDVPHLLGITQTQGLILTIIAIGVIGCLYLVLGGWKIVAVSDTINGLGLLIGGLLVPVFGLLYMGDGSFVHGLTNLAQKFPEKLNVIGGNNSPVPFGTVLTGIIIVNTFYWCTNQGIVQRTLGAKNLVEGQKGVLLTGALKLIGPIILVLPGVIAFHIFPNLKDSNMAYPMLVNKVLPTYLSGIFGAVLFGAVLSSFVGFLNSASTLFSFGIWGKLIKKDSNDMTIVRVGRSCTLILAIVSIIVAPFIANAPHGLFQWMKSLNAVYNGPLVTVIVMGFIFKKIPALAAKVALIFGIVVYITVKYIVDIPINFLYIVTILCVINVIVMLIIGKLKPRETPFVFVHSKKVDITQWVGAKNASIALMAGLIFIYCYLGTFGGYHLMIPAIICAIVAVVFGVLAFTKKQPPSPTDSTNSTN